jgi:hypothetical protein
MFRWVAVVLGLAAGALAQQPRIVNSGLGNQKPFLRDAGDLENLQVSLWPWMPQQVTNIGSVQKCG